MAQRVGGLLALALVAGGAVLVQELAQSDGGASTQVVQAPAPQAGGGPAAVDGLPTVPVPSLPEQARETLSLIDAGGPFPYEQDGSVFGNREGLLPQERRGCYREYTVETPGEDDRGARRIVTSCAGPRYWTADHYESFARIVPARL